MTATAMEIETETGITGTETNEIRRMTVMNTVNAEMNLVVMRDVRTMQGIIQIR